jgi:hypothetical protein
MHTLFALGVTILTAGSPAQPAAPALAATRPIDMVFLMPPFESAIAAVAQTTGVTIELDDTVTSEVRQQPLSDRLLKLAGAGLEETIALLTRMKGLSYTIVDARTVRIFKKA